jgi:hypothetical protein
MKRLVIGGAIAAVLSLAVLVYLAQRSSARADVANAPGNEPPPAKQVPHPPRHVTRLASSEERREVATEIAAAMKARHAADLAPASDPAPPPSAKPELPTADAQTIVTPLREAMREALPVLAECYSKALPTLANSHLSVAAHVRLTGDPDVGTLIDADELHDDADKPLPADLDSCLRDTFQQLELPPLAEGDKIDVTVPLRFSND